jgi:protein-tyrosine phosphatase
MVRVLFVCLGNICRSPMAEAVFAHKVREAGLEKDLGADSAGTGHWHVGERAHQGTRKVLQQQGIEYDGRARLITRRDLEEFDYVVTMDAHNLADVRAMGQGRAEVVPFLQFAPNAGVSDVPDPYYDGRFREVYDLVSQAADGLLAHIREEHEL